MDTFAERKAHTMRQMTELDRSKKGTIDAHITPLLEAINEQEDMYTTSSCSGRILLLYEPNGARKKDCEWPLITHDRADPDAFWEAIKNADSGGATVWLRMQTAIVHVACKDLDAANDLLSAFVNHGWKRSGIFSTANDVMVELLSVEAMDAPVHRDGALLVDQDFVSTFIQIANKKLSVVHDKITAATRRVKAR